MKPPVVPAGAHSMSYRVCYAETDRMGRVYYGTYYTFCERARTECMRAAGLPYRQLEDEGFFLPVRRSSARYYGYAVYDDELVMKTWVTRLRHATVTFATVLLRPPAEDILVAAEVELACVDAAGRPVALPSHAVEALQPFVG